MKGKSFFQTIHAPYYIYSYDYRHTSAGIKVLHHLCHALNEIGEEAYVYCDVTNPALRTPILTNDIKARHIANNRSPIAVYPEVVSGNPFNLPVVVRYVLNHPGHLGGEPHYQDHEIVFCFHEIFTKKDMEMYELFIPAADTNVFNNEDNEYDNKRQGKCFYANKYLVKGFRLTSESEGATDLGLHRNLTPQQLADILRKSELLYLYEPSAIGRDANLCGCPVIMIQSEYTAQECQELSSLKRPGVAFGNTPENIEYAKSTVHLAWDLYQATIASAWEQLANFVEITQAAAQQLNAKQPILVTQAQASNQEHTSATAAQAEEKKLEKAAPSSEYWKWLAMRNFHKEALRLMAENSAHLDKDLVQIILVDDSNKDWGFELTWDSLGAQPLNCWNTAVLATQERPEALAQIQAFPHWNYAAPDDFNAVLNTLASATNAEWLMISVPGVRVDPAFTAIISAMIERHPAWRFIYCDEDTIGRHARPRDPLLKPDANLDLLHSTCYVGNACLIHRELWQQIPPEEMIPGLLLNYAAALRCYEIFGQQAVGHIDEILVHQPHTLQNDLQQFEALGSILLHNYLLRQGISAEVSGGLVAGSFFVEYALARTPLVSIIIPTKNGVDLLKPCIDSIIERTGYSAYEIIIIDNASNCPETLKYLAELRNSGNRIKVLPYPHKYNYAAINNFAAAHANGEYLLLLNNDTVVLQNNWLERLVALGLREDVGAVGCRLVSPDQKTQHAGIVIGMGGAADSIGFSLPMQDVGYMGRAQLAQNFLAVTGACLLVRNSIFKQVGGLNEKDFPFLYSDVDLCLKIALDGYRNVWTPFVTLIHHNAASINKLPEADRNKRSQKSKELFAEKWISALGKDPCYNRHLSLSDNKWVIDGTFNVPWNPVLETGLPRIVAQPPDLMGVGYYRLLDPVKALTDSGHIESFLLPPTSTESRYLPNVAELVRAKPTTLFLQNAFTSWHVERVAAYVNAAPNIFRVFGQDDIVFAVPHKSAARQYFGKDTKARVRKAVGFCHRLIATSAPIAEAMRGMADDIRVMPNYLERSRWGDLYTAGKERKERRKPRVGWAGAQQHQGDLEFIIPVVEATANEVDWVFMGMCLAKLRYHISELHNPLSFAKYPAGLAALDLDLAIAPLEINRFNAAKSNLRILEYGAVGFPVICTDIEPYRNAPVTLVPNNAQAWIDAIRTHVHEMDATRAAGEKLHDWVLSNWMLDQHLDEWLHMLLPD